jgi:hypothetical protein
MTDDDTVDPATAGPDVAASDDAAASHDTHDDAESGPVGATDADPDDGLSADDSRSFQQNAGVINQFFGGVGADGATFGIAGAVSARRATGVITGAKVAVLLAGYVRPEHFDEAVRILRRERLLVLAGDEGSGKRLGALALLADVVGAGRSITSLPPSRTLAELANGEFQADRGYLVQDWSCDSAGSAVHRFDLDQLRQALDRPNRQAYLVLTGRFDQTQRRLLADVLVDAQPPDPLGVLAACPTSTVAALLDDEQAQLRERTAALRRPRDVVVVARNANRGVDKAFALLGEAEKQQVVSWFDQRPDPRPLLAVAALCFLDGTPDLAFQSLLSRLVVLVNQHVTLDSVTRSAVDGAPTGAFPQHVLGEHALDAVAVEHSDGDSAGSRVRRFGAPHFRDRAVAELVHRYGFELWEPLRVWIDEVAALPASPLQVRVSFGVALLAQYAPDVVMDLLREWSNGVAAQRLTAAYVLSWMCLDDAVAATALRVAQSWTTGAGTRRAETAAMAFGGELGIRYQTVALNQLWHLTLRNAAVSRTAAGALALLLWSAVQEADSASTMLRFLRSALRRLIDDRVGVASSGDHNKQIAKALGVIRLVLTSVVAGSAESVSAAVLRTLPGCIGVLGELWAEVLRSARNRGLGVGQLCDVLDVLRDDVTGMSVIAEFGTAIRDHLSPEENRLLRRQVIAEWNQRDKPTSRLLVAELLAALGAART